MNKDLGENLFVLDAIRAKNMTTAVYDARSNGAHATSAEIDLEDYNYPKEILIQISVGAVSGSGKVDVDVESGLTTGALSNTDYSFAQITAAGVATYHYKPTRRYINVEATVTGTSVDFCITLIMGALGWGSSGQA